MNIKNQLFGFLFLTLCLSCASHNTGNTNQKTESNITYENIDYSFKISTPKDWEIYREVLNDTLEKTAFVNWGIPKTYNGIEKIDFRNTVSIRAFKNNSIKNVQDLIQNEYLRINPTTTAYEMENGIGKNARMIYFDTQDGTKYKGKSYFKFKNGISYVLTFMANPATYEQDLRKFELFYSTLIIE